MNIIKKIFFFSLTILLLSALFWGVYNLSYKSEDKEEISLPENTASNKEEINPSEPVSSENKIAVVINEEIASPFLSSEKIRYCAKDGGVYEIDFYGNQKKEISSEKFPGLKETIWSLDGQKAILEIREGESNFFTGYDFSKKERFFVKGNADEIAWQMNADRIFYKFYDSKTQKRSLNVSDPDGKNWSKIADVSERNISISQIPKSGLVSFWNQGESFEKTSLKVVPITGGEVKEIFSDGFGSDYLWDGSGSKALVGKVEARGGGKMQLGTINANGGEYKNLDIPTFVSKCVWSKDGKTVYFALPGNIPQNSILPNDYKEDKFFTADTFWKIDLESGEKTRIVEIKDIKEKYDAKDVFLDQKESLIFFVNRIDGKLYKIIL